MPGLGVPSMQHTARATRCMVPSRGSTGCAAGAGMHRPPYATSSLTCSSVRNMMTFHDPSRPKLGRKPL